MMDTTGWFRQPKTLEMCRVGDSRRYLLVAEPEAMKGVFGVCYVVAESLLITHPDILGVIQSAAAGELERRIKAGDSHGEGCTADAFAWDPVIRRDEFGAITVDGAAVLDAVDVRIDPIYRVDRNATIDTKDLYARPGRIIKVDGGDPTP